MRQPLNRGTPIDQQRYDRWMAQFSGYHDPVTNSILEMWLRQFRKVDRDLAARILDSVLFIPAQAVKASFLDGLNSLEGWSTNASQRRGRWFFVPYSGSVGESGDSMLHLFRIAASLTQKKYADLFIHRSEIVEKKLGPDDTVVLIDDYSGTGKQVCDYWNDIFQELLSGGSRVFILLVAATAQALTRIENETEIMPICTRILDDGYNVFHSTCSHFSPGEKQTILHYCHRADQITPKGFGDAGLLVVLSHQCPNDSIPILHTVSRAWRGLFPRH